jgi:hypothetical protein
MATYTPKRGVKNWVAIAPYTLSETARGNLRAFIGTGQPDSLRKEIEAVLGEALAEEALVDACPSPAEARAALNRIRGHAARLADAITEADPYTRAMLREAWDTDAGGCWSCHPTAEEALVALARAVAIASREAERQAAKRHNGGRPRGALRKRIEGLLRALLKEHELPEAKIDGCVAAILAEVLSK